MKIKNISIMSKNAIDFEYPVSKQISVLCGEHSALALDLIREVIGDHRSENDPDSVDDGRFVVHCEIEMDDKNFNVCYIRNADYMGDNRIAANFVPNSFAFSEDDTEEFLALCRKRDKDSSNAIYNGKIFSLSEDDRPLFVYLEDADEITQVLQTLSCLKRQVFVAVDSEYLELEDCVSLQVTCLG